MKRMNEEMVENVMGKTNKQEEKLSSDLKV